MSASDIVPIKQTDATTQCQQNGTLLPFNLCTNLVESFFNYRMGHISELLGLSVASKSLTPRRRLRTLVRVLSSRSTHGLVVGRIIFNKRNSKLTSLTKQYYYYLFSPSCARPLEDSLELSHEAPPLRVRTPRKQPLEKISVASKLMF